MNGTNLMDYIPPEQIGLIIVATIGVGIAFLGALVFLIKWGAEHFAKVQEAKLVAFQQENESKARDAEAARDIKLLEIQNKLDETQSSRELVLTQSKEAKETREAFMSIIEDMREDTKKRDGQNEKFLSEITDSFRGIQSNTAATLDFLKLHAESDSIMYRNQEKIISQTEASYQKLSDVITSLAEIAIELKGITVGRASDREILNDILSKVGKLQESIATIEALAKAPPQTVAATTPNATDVTSPESPTALPVKDSE